MEEKVKNGILGSVGVLTIGTKEDNVVVDTLKRYDLYFSKKQVCLSCYIQNISVELMEKIPLLMQEKLNVVLNFCIFSRGDDTKVYQPINNKVEMILENCKIQDLQLVGELSEFNSMQIMFTVNKRDLQIYSNLSQGE